jgi:hypothetical protein
MAAGQGFKTFVTGDVLTAADTNGYLMQGVWVFASAAARDAAVTSPQEGNMCYLKDTDATQSYSGSAWTAVGGGGGMTLISTTTLSGTSNSITVAANTYKDLVAYIYGLNPNATAALTLRINGITGGVYQETMTYGQENGVVAHAVNNYTAMNLSVSGSMAVQTGVTTNVWVSTFRDANSTVRKLIATNGNYVNSSNNNVTTMQTDVVSTATSAITNITLISTQTLTAGTLQLYGVK